MPGRNDLAGVRSELATMVDPMLNEGVDVAAVFAGTRRAIWWRAGCGHVLELKVCVRAKAKAPSCPYCSGRKVPERPIAGLR